VEDCHCSKHHEPRGVRPAAAKGSPGCRGHCTGTIRPDSRRGWYGRARVRGWGDLPADSAEIAIHNADYSRIPPKGVNQPVLRQRGSPLGGRFSEALGRSYAEKHARCGADAWPGFRSSCG